MRLFRKTLIANNEEIFSIESHFITILNLGAGNVYVNFDKAATVNSLLIPPWMGRDFYFPYTVKNVHVISNETPLVQIDNWRG